MNIKESAKYILITTLVLVPGTTEAYFTFLASTTRHSTFEGLAGAGMLILCYYYAGLLASLNRGSLDNR